MKALTIQIPEQIKFSDLKITTDDDKNLICDSSILTEIAQINRRYSIFEDSEFAIAFLFSWYLFHLLHGGEPNEALDQIGRDEIVTVVATSPIRIEILKNQA